MDKKLKVFEMFAGYGGASFALKKANIDHEIVGYSEIDKFAIQCYEQNHQGKNYGDATKIVPKELPDMDIITGGFPCQSFSVAGKGLGELDTRGSLFNDIIRIAEEKQPKYMLLENVKGLLSKRHIETFSKIMLELNRIGYTINYKVLNSKNYGIPQNRERVFFMCCRKDLDNNNIQFPDIEELSLFLKDILEDEVDEKYYLSEDKINTLLNNNNWNCNPSGKGMNGKVHQGVISPTITTNKGEGHKIAIPCLTPDRINKRQNGRRFKTDGEPMFTLNTQDRHGVLCIEDFYSTKRSARIYDNIVPTLRADRSGLLTVFPNRPEISIGKRIYRAQGISPSLNTTTNVRILENLTIRKLTPKECFRLMGFLDDGINLEGISNSQRYKLAGNGWDINLVSKIFKQMFKETSK